MAKKNVKTEMSDEERDAPLKFTFRGIDLELPQGSKVPRKAMRAFEDSRMITFVEEMLGPEQLEQVDEELATMGDVRELSDLILEAQDTTVGE